MFRYEFCVSMISTCWDTENPIFHLSAFFSWGPFWKCPRRRNASQIFLLTWQILILLALTCKNYKSVDLCEGCMMGLPRLWPTKRCMHGGPEFMGSFSCCLKVSWHYYDTNNNPTHTMLVWNEIPELVLSICDNFSDEIYYQACVDQNNSKRNALYWTSFIQKYYIYSKWYKRMNLYFEIKMIQLFNS